MNSDILTILIAITVEASSPRESTDVEAFIVKISQPYRFARYGDVGV
jgi:hypothetical protein